MPDSALPIEGGCRCGAVRFRVTQAPMVTMACHCSNCQKMSASAFSLSVAVPVDSFEVTTGEPVTGGMHGDQVQHRHCDWCKSWVFTQIPGAPFVNIRATMLDDPAPWEPYLEMQTAEKLPWASTPAKHSFGRFPPPDAFGPLIAEYQAARSGTD
ncbi:GFA family protein [Stakelama tenebrarum]|uniref:GFA family protein n=1 Tax=Stakelama tenebrarum TaxID=2711215 RepID=A0A6G6Y8N5_9SPHN|nr:GFA family protein [Sphingosinithalassobacter tenebrarum]QIG81279.1 GFA family protein [Sphingosinithalassobacter tenebrarum]